MYFLALLSIIIYIPSVNGIYIGINQDRTGYKCNDYHNQNIWIGGHNFEPWCSVWISSSLSQISPDFFSSRVDGIDNVPELNECTPVKDSNICDTTNDLWKPNKCCMIRQNNANLMTMSLHAKDIFSDKYLCCTYTSKYSSRYFNISIGARYYVDVNTNTYGLMQCAHLLDLARIEFDCTKN